MTSEKARTDLVNLLASHQAHVTMEDAVKDVRPESRTRPPAPGMHTLWDLIEHIRIVQEDILRYTLDPSWESPAWPDKVWPAPADTISDEMWNESLRRYYSDRDELAGLARNSELDLAAAFPHGEGRTYLRQIMLAADHTAYHLGQVAYARKIIGDWYR